MYLYSFMLDETKQSGQKQCGQESSAFCFLFFCLACDQVSFFCPGDGNF